MDQWYFWCSNEILKYLQLTKPIRKCILNFLYGVTMKTNEWKIIANMLVLIKRSHRYY